MSEPSIDSDEARIAMVLTEWAAATRQGRKDDVLSSHTEDVLIYDVLAPMKYEGARADRDSWGDWQPDTQGEGVFDFQDLRVTAGDDVAFAHAFVHCGGTTPEGRSFEDLVRATFCLVRRDGAWAVAHQHISKPISLG